VSARVSDRLDQEAQWALIDLARRSIQAGLAGQTARVPDDAELEALPAAVRARRGVFVTVKVRGELNGCIGSLDARDPLAVAVPALAWDSAFADPRLPALTPADEDGLEIELSVLSPLEKMATVSEAELVAAVRPGVDGLVIGAGTRRATFLPAVWEALPEPLDFVRHLEAKARIRPGHWPEGMEAFRYTAQEFGSGDRP
jgi:AmmeMemoRadiSam system protein A